MEPRPQRPSRATGPYISTGTPNPPGASPMGSGFGTGAFDASSAPPAPPPSIGYDPDYSPGQPLTPLRGPRGANIVGPLLAVAALAIIVAAVAFIVSQFRESGNDNNPPPTTIAAANGSPTSSSEESSANPTKSEGSGAATEDPNAEPTRTPRVNRTAESTEDLTGTSETGSDSPKERTTARQWLPTDSTVGDGYERSDNGTRDADQVAGSFPDPAEAASKLTEFDWVENAFREYTLPNGGAADTTVVTVSVHRFKTEGGAKDAMPYFVSGSNLPEVEDAKKFGEESTTVAGPIEAGAAYVIYIRQDKFVLRISGFSAEGNPAETTDGVAERLLEP